MPDAVVVADPTGKIVFANKKAEGLTGYSRRELLGRPVEILVPFKVRVMGKLYAIGGSAAGANVSPTEEYNTAANSWVVLPPLPQPRNHVAGFVWANAPCVAGGRSPNTAHVDCLDISHRVWTRLPNLPAATSGEGAVVLGGTVIVAGGEDATENRMIPQLSFFVVSGQWSAGPRMLAPRHGFELALFNGRAWACGGGSAPGLDPVATCTSLGDPSTSQG